MVNLILPFFLYSCHGLCIASHTRIQPGVLGLFTESERGRIFLSQHHGVSDFSNGHDTTSCFYLSALYWLPWSRPFIFRHVSPR